MSEHSKRRHAYDSTFDRRAKRVICRDPNAPDSSNYNRTKRRKRPRGDIQTAGSLQFTHCHFEFYENDGDPLYTAFGGPVSSVTFLPSTKQKAASRGVATKRSDLRLHGQFNDRRTSSFGVGNEQRGHVKPLPRISDGETSRGLCFRRRNQITKEEDVDAVSPGQTSALKYDKLRINKQANPAFVHKSVDMPDVDLSRGFGPIVTVKSSTAGDFAGTVERNSALTASIEDSVNNRRVDPITSKAANFNRIVDRSECSFANRTLDPLDIQNSPDVPNQPHRAKRMEVGDFHADAHRQLEVTTGHLPGSQQAQRSRQGERLGIEDTHASRNELISNSGKTRDERRKEETPRSMSPDVANWHRYNESRAVMQSHKHMTFSQPESTDSNRQTHVSFTKQTRPVLSKTTPGNTAIRNRKEGSQGIQKCQEEANFGSVDMGLCASAINSKDGLKPPRSVDDKTCVTAAANTPLSAIPRRCHRRLTVARGPIPRNSRTCKPSSGNGEKNIEATSGASGNSLHRKAQSQEDFLAGTPTSVRPAGALVTRVPNSCKTESMSSVTLPSQEPSDEYERGQASQSIDKAVTSYMEAEMRRGSLQLDHSDRHETGAQLTKTIQVPLVNTPTNFDLPFDKVEIAGFSGRSPNAMYSGDFSTQLDCENTLKATIAVSDCSEVDTGVSQPILSRIANGIANEGYKSLWPINLQLCAEDSHRLISVGSRTSSSRASSAYRKIAKRRDTPQVKRESSDAVAIRARAMNRARYLPDATSDRVKLLLDLLNDLPKLRELASPDFSIQSGGTNEFGEPSLLIKMRDFDDQASEGVSVECVSSVESVVDQPIPGHRSLFSKPDVFDQSMAVDSVDVVDQPVSAFPGLRLKPDLFEQSTEIESLQVPANVAHHIGQPEWGIADESNVRIKYLGCIQSSNSDALHEAAKRIATESNRKCIFVDKKFWPLVQRSFKCVVEGCQPIPSRDAPPVRPQVSLKVFLTNPQDSGQTGDGGVTITVVGPSLVRFLLGDCPSFLRTSTAPLNTDLISYRRGWRPNRQFRGLGIARRFATYRLFVLRKRLNRYRRLRVQVTPSSGVFNCSNPCPITCMLARSPYLHVTDISGRLSTFQLATHKRYIPCCGMVCPEGVHSMVVCGYHSNGICLFVAGFDGIVRIYGRRTGIRVGQINIGTSIHSMYIKYDLLLVGDSSGHLLLFNRRKQIAFSQAISSGSSIIASIAGARINLELIVFAGSYDGDIYWHNVNRSPVVSGKMQRAHHKPARSLRASTAHNCLYSCSADKLIAVHNMLTGNLVKTIGPYNDIVTSLEVFNKGNHFVASSYDGIIDIFDTTTFDLILTLDRPDKRIMSVRQSYRFLFIATDDGTVDAVPCNPGQYVTCLYSNCGRKLATQQDLKFHLLRCHFGTKRVNVHRCRWKECNEWVTSNNRVEHATTHSACCEFARTTDIGPMPLN